MCIEDWGGVRGAEWRGDGNRGIGRQGEMEEVDGRWRAIGLFSRVAAMESRTKIIDR